MAEPLPDTVDLQQQNLIDLQAASLRLMALFAGAIGFFWFILVAWPETGSVAPSLAAWAGGPLLALAAVLAFLLRERAQILASALFTGGVWLGMACALPALRSLQAAYLFILPIIFAGMLLGQEAAHALAGLSVVTGLLTGLRILDLPLISIDLWLPLVIIALVAVALWLSARSLYTALDWVWSGYEQAHRNEQAARAGQAELRRVLKALDEATYRLERANHMLALARDQAEEARRLKQQFAQTISHELRTPLNLIVGFAELMAKSPEYYGSPLPPAYLRDLGIVHRNANHLQSLVSDVLDLARIEVAEMSMIVEEVDPGALVCEAVNTARSLVEARGLALRTEIEPGLPKLWLDPTRIRQVLFNLLNNAARYTDSGSVTVGVRRQAAEVVTFVTDTGPGIAPQDTTRIFDEFQQLDGTTRRRHGGAGLGLAICKRFVELHGGRIWVESQPGRGSTFYFSLPGSRPDALAEAAEPPAQAVAAAPAPDGQQGLLLVVTRSLAAAGLLSRHVRNYRTAIFQNLEQARLAAQQLLPQGVLVDTIQEQLGAEQLQELARAWSLPRTLFMACPLPGEESLRQRLAVDGYLIKPISQEGLWDVLRRFGERIDRVLAIDDDSDFVRLVTRLLENPLRRYQVVPADSGQKGLEVMEHYTPDLVLLDLGLPDMDGTQVIERIRANPAWRDIPIVIISGREEINTAQLLPGPMILAAANGLTSSEVVRWVQNVMQGA